MIVVFSTADERFEWKRTLLAGHPGHGLTRAAASWPRPLYVRFRPGLPELAGRAVPFTIVQSVDDLLGVLDTMATTGPVETLVIDTVEDLEHLIGDDAKKMDVLMGAISALPVHVVLLCRLTHKDGRQFPHSCLNGGILTYVDVALCVEDGRLQARPDDRLPWVLDRSGLLPRTVPLTFTDDYARLAAAMAQDLGARAPQQVAEAPDVVAPPPPPPPAPAAAPVAAPAAPPAAPPVAAVATVAAAPAVAAPPPAPAAEEEGDDPAVELPMCTSQGRLGNPCLGRVESAYARDVSVIRFRKPMCGPCNEAEYEAMPKKIAAPRARPTGPAPDGTVPAPGRQPRDEDIAVMPHGEVIGQVAPPDDQDLRAFLSS